MRQFRLHTILAVAFITIATKMIAQTNTGIRLKWEKAAMLPASEGKKQALGQAGLLAGVHKDVMVLAGGANFPEKKPWMSGRKRYYSDVFVFEKNDKGKIRPLHKTFKLPYNTAYGASCSTFQGIVYAGGENESGISNKVILVQWDPVGKNIKIVDLPSLPFPVTNASATNHGSRIFIAGGETPDGGVSSKFLSLDLLNPSSGWRQLADLPRPVSHSVMVVQSNGENDLIYVIGGRKRNTGGISDLYKSVYAYDFIKNQWREQLSMPYALSAGTGIAVGRNFILMFGGDKGETFHKAESLISAINMEKDEQKKAQLNSEKIKVQSSHPGFSKEVMSYSTLDHRWIKVGCVPYEVPVTTTAIKWDEYVVIPSGEVKAGVRSPQILLVQIDIRKEAD